MILHFVICGETRLYLDLFVNLGSKDVPGPSSAPSNTGKLAVKGSAGKKVGQLARGRGRW